MATYDREEVQKVVFSKPQGGCSGGQCGPPPDVHQVPIGESPQPEGGDEGGDEQGQDQIFKEAQDILDAMYPSDEPVSCGSVDASMDKQEGDLDLVDSIEADEAIQQIEDEVAKKGDGKHPFGQATQPGTGEGGGDYVIALPEVKKTPRWVKLIREFGEKDFDKVKGKKELDAPFSFAYGFVQRGKVRAPEFKKHMYIMADVSGSMMGGVIGEGDSLLEELLAFIPKLSEDYSIELWFVSSGLLKKENGEDAIYTSRELEDKNNKEFAKWLVEVSQEVPMGGGTSFDQPFEQMLEERDKSDTDGVVVALTDTDFSVKPIPKNTMIITDEFNKPTLDKQYKDELKDKALNFHIIDFKQDK